VEIEAGEHQRFRDLAETVVHYLEKERALVKQLGGLPSLENRESFGDPRDDTGGGGPHAA
jgi:hypothetical protein